MRFPGLKILYYFYCSLITVSLAYGQTTYHISSSGNDSYPGTEAQPWKSMKKINSTTFNPGDAILFKRGDTFQGEISKTFNGTASQPIVIGAYGTGAKPIIYGDMTSAVWTKTPGHDGIYQAFAGTFTEGTGYEKQSGVWTLINKNNQGELHFYLYRPDSLNKFLNNLTKSTWGYGNDTVWIHTYDGNPPVVHIFHEASYISGSYSIIQDLEFRNCWSALKTTNGRNLIWRNISTCNTMAPALFLCGNVRNCLVEYCTVDSAGYTALYDYVGGYRNIFRADTVRNVKSNILGLPKTFTEQCGIGFQGDTACVVEYCVFSNLTDYALDSYMNHQDTARYNTITNTLGGMQLYGYEWVAHNNSINLSTGGNGINVSNYGTKQTTVYNNVIRNVTTGSGLKVSSRQSGTTVFYGNTVEAPNSYTFFDEFVVGGVTSTNNTFIGSGRFHSQGTSYSTLAAFQAAGFEAGSTINGSTYPIISTSTSSLSFGNVLVNSTSSEKTYIIQGSNLSPASGNITITAPTGYQVSKTSGTGFTSSVVVAYTGGTLSSTAIYVRFHPTETQVYSGSITNAGGGATTKYVSVTGTGISGASPTITVDPLSLAFDNVIVNTTSNEKVYTLQCSNLSPASGDITITSPSGYQVSLTSGSGFSSSLNVSYTGSTLTSKTIYVRFSPTAAKGYVGNIVNSGGSATTQNVLLTGNGISSATPVIAISPSLLAFSTVRVNTPSSERIYTVQGSSLSPASGNITITSPSGYQVSLTSGSGFSSSLNVSYTGGTLALKTIYVLFSPTIEQAYTGNISNIGGGVPTQNVAVTGTGISATSAALTVNPTSISFGDVVNNTTSSEKSFGLTGLNLSPATDSITIQATDGFTISTSSGTGFTSLKRIAYVGGMLQPIPKMIYVRFSPTAEQNYYGIVASWGGTSEVQTVSISGKGISPPQPTLTVEPVSFSFGNVANNTISSEQTYVLEGSNLSPLNGNITITAPAGFQVSSTTGSGFDASITISYSGGVLPAKTIYGRFFPTALQSYSGNITNAGGGATAATVSVSGNGAVPTITVNLTSLPFSSVVINTISSERTFVLSASNLSPSSGEIIVTAPSTDFQVSLTTGSGFDSSVTIPYSGGAITTPRTIFVRFLPTIEGGYSGNITSSGGGAATQIILVNGIGVLGTAPLITTNPTSLFFENIPINTTSSQKTYTLSGINLSPENGNLTVTAPTGFQVSTESGMGFDSSLTITYNGGVLNESNIYVRFCPTIPQAYSGNITNTEGGAEAKSVYVYGSSLPSLLTIIPDSLSFGSVIINTSSVKTYSLSGSNLQPADDTVKITAPTGFTLSTASGSEFNPSINIPYIGDNLSLTIYVKFSPVALQNYIGNIEHTVGGAAMKYMSVNGESGTPSLIVSSPSVTFGKVIINTASAESTYTIRGSNLIPASGNIIITAPSGFEVSITSGYGFNSSINIPYTSNILFSTAIYIRFSPIAVQNYIGNITNDGGGAATQVVEVSGNGAYPSSLIVSVDSLSFGQVIINGISEKSYTLFGTNLVPDGTISITSPKGFQVSATRGTGFGSSLSIPYSGDELSSRSIYVRFSPTVVQNYNGTIINTGGGVPGLNIAVSGIGLPLSEIVQLGQNYPNPFNPTTKIPYSVYMKSWVKLTIYNILGQQIRTLINEEQDIGYYRPEFDISRDNNGQELSSGVYFYRLEIAGSSFTKKLLLLK